MILAIFDKTWKKEPKFRKLKKKFWNNGVKTVENSKNWGWVENVQGVIESFHHSWIDVFLFKVVLIFENLWYKWNIFFNVWSEKEFICRYFDWSLEENVLFFVAIFELFQWKLIWWTLLPFCHTGEIPPRKFRDMMFFIFKIFYFINVKKGVSF